MLGFLYFHADGWTFFFLEKKKIWWWKFCSTKFRTFSGYISRVIRTKILIRCQENESIRKSSYIQGFLFFLRFKLPNLIFKQYQWQINKAMYNVSKVNLHLKSLMKFSTSFNQMILKKGDLFRLVNIFNVNKNLSIKVACTVLKGGLVLDVISTLVPSSKRCEMPSVNLHKSWFCLFVEIAVEIKPPLVI